MELSVLVKKEILEQWRTKKILVLCIIFLFVAIASPILAKLTPELLKNISVPGMVIKLPEPTFRDAIDQFMKNLSQVALLVLIFLVAGAVSDEKNKKTLEILLTKPISRTKFIFSKFIGYFLSISLVFVVTGGLFYSYTSVIFGQFDLVKFLFLAGLTLLYILMMVSVTILASAVLGNSIVAGGVGFSIYLIFGTVFGFIPGLKEYSPNIIFSDYKSLIDSGVSGHFLWPTVVTFAVILISILIAVTVFKNQEVER
jgi:ABC-2 type transport system permease protein